MAPRSVCTTASTLWYQILKNDNFQCRCNRIFFSINSACLGSTSKVMGRLQTSQVPADFASGLTPGLRETEDRVPPLINAFFSVPPSPGTETTRGRPTARPQSIALCVFTANETCRRKDGRHRLACGYAVLSDIS